MRVLILLLISSACFGQDIVVKNTAELDAAMRNARSGQTVFLRAGTYRMTVVPTNSGVTFRNYENEVAVISGLNQVTTPWTVHNGQIYKTSITLPVNGFQHNLTSNTTILANQIFKDGVMQFQARWPKVNSVEDLIDRTKYRHHSQTQGIGYSQLTDNGLPPGNFTGAAIWVTGWFISESRRITGHSNKTLTYETLRAQNGNKFQKWYYITNDLELLTQAKEWHYENGTLYFWQQNGGLPTWVEYKARNWGFDLRGKSGTKIIGLHFIGCEPATGDTGTNNTVIDNIRAQYNNHAFLTTTGGDYNYFNAKQTGIKLLGSGNVIKNSEFRHISSQVIWASHSTIVENNLCYNIGWEGNYGAFVTPWEGTNSNIKILRNTAYRLGRSAVDFGHGTHTNMEIAYNDFHTFSMVTSDVGVIYGCCYVKLTGTRIHHNWLHDNMVGNGWSGPQGGANYDGIHVNLYFDQAAGPTTVDHNIMWNGAVSDYYSQIHGVTQNVYNNTFATPYGSYQREAYFVPYDTPSDRMRNNIFRHDVNINWKIADSNNNAGEPGDVENSVFRATDPQFIGTGEGGLKYQLKPTSPAVNAGTVISGITDGSVGTPDAGAYEYGVSPWTAGYKSVIIPPDTLDPIPPDTLDPEPPRPPVIQPLKDTVFDVTVNRGYKMKGINVHHQDSVPATNKIEAESGTLTGAGIEAIPGGQAVCCITPGGTLKYSSSSTGKIKIRYSRGNSGNGTLTIGNTTLTFESTGDWKVYREKEFNVTGKLDFVNGSIMGPCNIDWIERMN